MQVRCLLLCNISPEEGNGRLEVALACSSGSGSQGDTVRASAGAAGPASNKVHLHGSLREPHPKGFSSGLLECQLPPENR